MSDKPDDTTRSQTDIDDVLAKLRQAQAELEQSRTEWAARVEDLQLSSREGYLRAFLSGVGSVAGVVAAFAAVGAVVVANNQLGETQTQLKNLNDVTKSEFSWRFYDSMSDRLGEFVSARALLVDADSPSDRRYADSLESDSLIELVNELTRIEILRRDYPSLVDEALTQRLTVWTCNTLRENKGSAEKVLGLNKPANTDDTGDRSVGYIVRQELGDCT